MPSRPLMLATLLVASLLVASIAPASRPPLDEVPLRAWEARMEEPGAGSWRAWILDDPASVLPPPPPDEAGTLVELEELRALALARTPDALAKAERWDEGPANVPWVDLHFEALGANGLHPPLAARNLAVVDVAIHDAVIAAWHAKREYGREGPGVLDPTLPAMAPRGTPSYPSEHAVVAGAASTVLAWLYPADAARYHALAEEAAESRLHAGLNFRSDVEAGLALGRAVGGLVVAARADDGVAEAAREYPLDLVPSGPDAPYGACSWKPTPTRFEGPWGVEMGDVTPFLLTAEELDAAMAPPPVPCDSEEYLAQHFDVYERSFEHTDEARLWAEWWHDHGWAHPRGHLETDSLAVAGTFAPLLRDWVVADGLSTPRSTRAFALLHAALADTFISIWKSKYVWWTERPVTVVHEHFGDPGWLPLIETPSFPGYPSGHSGQGGAAGEVLAHLFPHRGVVARAWGLDDTRAREVAGVHPEFDDDEGREQGIRVARHFIEWARSDGAENVPPAS